MLAAGLFIAAPFATNCGLGTSEAYNYSLSVADYVTQARAGVFPVLVGQSQYAWNGRVHPLRTAPYLTAMAGLLDFLTDHTLGFWTLQNLVVGLSLLGGALSCYFCLRRAVPELGGDTAALLAAAYGLAPGLLATAYAMDLYMTVTAAPWIPVVLGGLVCSWRTARPGAYAQAAIGLAACWLAHPPVAFWLTAACLAVGLGLLGTGRVRGRAAMGVLGAGLLFAVLAGYGFVSALTVEGYHAITHVKNVQPLLDETRRAFAASLRPVSPTANHLGDFQLGYAYWALLALTLVLAAVRRQPLALIFAGVSLFFLALTLPVPGVQARLWNLLPTLAVTLTNQWPMQRFYLLVTAFTIFAFALVWRPPARPLTGAVRDFLQLVLVLAIAWTAWEALHFVSRGFTTRLEPAVSRRMHRPENVNLTIISFALLGTPPWFVNGVMDPAMEFRLREPYDARVVEANTTAPFPQQVEHGTFQVTAMGPGKAVLGPSLTLKPGLQYRLTFHFKIPPLPAVLQLLGPGFFREYSLPQAGGPAGFGMRPGDSHSLFLWTTADHPVRIELHLVAPGIEARDWTQFADFTLDATAVDRLPVALKSLIPLRAQVRAASPGYLETPRMYLPGYSATVDGRPVPVQPSPDGLVMLPVPAGLSRVELRYPGLPMLRAAFWLTFAGWAGVVVVVLLLPPSARRRLRLAPGAAWERMRRIRLRTLLWAGLTLLVLGSAATGVTMWRRWRAAAGPVVMDVIFPRDFFKGTQPLLVTGRPHAGTFIYVRYVDHTHIRFGLDVWGVVGALSEPVKVDYYAAHRIEISTGALYPPGNPAVKALPAAERDRLRHDVRVTLDGRVVLQKNTRQWGTTLSEITVGANPIGGSNAGIRFTGRILDVHRVAPVRDR